MSWNIILDLLIIVRVYSIFGIILDLLIKIGPGNERADEWCSGQDILSDERVDVHEDNEDHVENVIGSSQDQVVSNVTPTSSLLKLWLIGGVFSAISRHAVKLFKTMFKGAYATWTQVPQDHRDRRSIDEMLQKVIRFVMLGNLILGRGIAIS
ncbi:hypothetical protein Tco_0724815 [Tanacetum coccineum]|uniref:Uncharacterized protein n=1 Tax=Tanacetum coccineum TaxID=301880 RepID=A0ABQ4YB62_9ASTR